MWNSFFFTYCKCQCKQIKSTISCAWNLTSSKAKSTEIYLLTTSETRRLLLFDDTLAMYVVQTETQQWLHQPRKSLSLRASWYITLRVEGSAMNGRSEEVLVFVSSSLRPVHCAVLYSQGYTNIVQNGQCNPREWDRRFKCEICVQFTVCLYHVSHLIAV